MDRREIMVHLQEVTAATAHKVATVTRAAPIIMVVMARREVMVLRVLLTTEAMVLVLRVVITLADMVVAATVLIWADHRTAVIPEWVVTAVLLMAATTVAQLPVAMVRAEAVILAAAQIWAPGVVMNLVMAPKVVPE